MESRVTAYKCPKCHGKGRIKEGKSLFKSWMPCDNCLGVGYLGTDDVYQYYLERGTDGKYRVKDIKQDRFFAEEALRAEKIQFIRNIVVLLLVIAYVVFAIFYELNYKTDVIFLLVTVGFLVLLFILITRKLLLYNLLRSLFGYFFSEPKDFKWALKERIKREKQED